MSEGVFCDFLGVTFPREEWDNVRQGIGPCLDTIGAQVEYDEPDSTLWRAGDGTVKAKRYGAVMSLGASGLVTAALRFGNVFGNYLAAIGASPHTVTRLDASRDVVEDTPPAIDRIVEQASSAEGLSLTRKRVQPKHVTRLVARREDGLDTGTCYVGSRTADVRMAVYDKRVERMTRGLPDIGPLTRYELRLTSGAGLTLRDALDPTNVFWHFMPEALMAPPADVVPWVSHAIGFRVDWPALPPPAVRLRTRVHASADVAALLALATEVGPYGFDLLVQELRKLATAVPLGVQGPAPAETASIAH